MERGAQYDRKRAPWTSAGARLSWSVACVTGLVVACGGQSGRRAGPGPSSSAGAGAAGSGGLGASGGGAGGGGAGSGINGGQGGGGSPGKAGTGSGGEPSAGTGASGGSGGAMTGGTDAGGSSEGGEAPMGGAAGAGPSAGPCDLFRDAGQPCAAAYSTVRRLLSTYGGPLYQIRSDSSVENTGSGGQTHDVPQTDDGYADTTIIGTACAGTVCTVSLVYDQSGDGNDLPVAKAGIQAGGPNAATDDFESSATSGALSVAGHDVFALYMEPRQGYRLPNRGAGIPYRDAPSQGIYLLADGTRASTGCCWEFGNVGPVATFSEPIALFLGIENGDRGAGEGPWFMADFGGGIWAGGSQGSDPGHGPSSMADETDRNPQNPSMRSPFSLGFLKTNQSDYALRMADAAGAGGITTAYRGPVPKRIFYGGTVALGVDQENANGSFGTFYEGAIVSGFPSDETELAVLENVRAAGYAR
jgi:non-reducing end alpha-L-arabinofuranosidase